MPALINTIGWHTAQVKNRTVEIFPTVPPHPLLSDIFTPEHAYTLINIQHRILFHQIRHRFYFTRQDIEKGDNMSPDLAREV